MGVSGKVQEVAIYDDMPVYTGNESPEKREYEKAWSHVKKRGLLPGDRVHKKSFTIEKWQPLTKKHLESIEGTFESKEEYDKWLQDNTQELPVAVMPMDGKMQTMRIFDEYLADFLGIKHAEFILKKNLSPNEEEEEEVQDDYYSKYEEK